MAVSTAVGSAWMQLAPPVWVPASKHTTRVAVAATPEDATHVVKLDDGREVHLTIERALDVSTPRSSKELREEQELEDLKWHVVRFGVLFGAAVVAVCAINVVAKTFGGGGSL